MLDPLKTSENGYINLLGIRKHVFTSDIDYTVDMHFSGDGSHNRNVLITGILRINMRIVIRMSTTGYVHNTNTSILIKQSSLLNV